MPEIRLIEELERWSSLRTQWNDLLARSTARSLFLTWEWLASWWEAFGAGAKLQILQVLEGDESIGFAPLFKTGEGWKEELRFLGDGSGDSERLDMIAKPGREYDVLTASLQFLEGRQNPVVWRFRLIPEASLTPENIRRYADQAGRVLHTETEPYSSVPLPAEFDTYLLRLRPRFRTKVRAQLRKLDSDERFLVEILEDSSRIDGWLEELFRLHSLRWATADDLGSFRDPSRKRFYQLLTPRLHEAGWLRFYRLCFEGRPVALQFGFEYAGVFSQLQEGLDPEYLELSPGGTLRSHIFRQLIRTGSHEYDFLGGFTRHKADWAAEPSTYVNVLSTPDRLPYSLLVTAPPMVRRLRDRTRQAIPSSILGIKRRIQERTRRRRVRSKIRQKPGPDS